MENPPVGVYRGNFCAVVGDDVLQSAANLLISMPAGGRHTEIQDIVPGGCGHPPLQGGEVADLVQKGGQVGAGEGVAVGEKKAVFVHYGEGFFGEGGGCGRTVGDAGPYIQMEDVLEKNGGFLGGGLMVLLYRLIQF